MNPKISYYKYTSFKALLSIGRSPKPPACFSVILYEERFLLVFVNALWYNKHMHTAQKEDTYYELHKRSHPNRTVDHPPRVNLIEAADLSEELGRFVLSHPHFSVVLPKQV